jgi:hypothetical protein
LSIVSEAMDIGKKEGDVVVTGVIDGDETAVACQIDEVR